jgi:tRNA pseudouridine13 synthase
MSEWPYLTASLEGLGGQIKQRPEDFRVEEIPAYEPCGQGTHVYFRVQKRGVASHEARDRIARHMKVQSRDIGLAGLKDARAETVQLMSLEHADQQRLSDYDDGQVRVVWTGRHGNKLRTGHLRGNRFTIRIRDVDSTCSAKAQAVLDVLGRRGCPNYFGPQRFGARGDTHLAIFLGRPGPGDSDDIRAARDAYDAGDLARALKRWPRSFAPERKALSAFSKRKRPRDAIAAIDIHLRRLYVSAWQSWIFNEILARRLDSLDRVSPGDWAEKAENGALFLVDDPDEQARAEAGEISPTGPLPGYRVKLADRQPGLIEREVFDEYNIDLEAFRRLGPVKAKGARRALRFCPKDLSARTGQDGYGRYLEVAFAAPPGCYATSLLREITKNDASNSPGG